jgi:glycine/D-amino acid oxidase-like deaminating enzyme
MIELMNHSIDLLEELAHKSSNTFQLNRRGYLYCTADQPGLDRFVEQAQSIAGQGGGELRVQDRRSSAAYQPASPHNWENQPDGADLILDQALLRAQFPYLATNIIAALHARRAGWFSGQQFGAHLLAEALSSGVQLVQGRITEVEGQGGRVSGVRLADGRRIQCECFVNAAGPLLKQVGMLAGIDLPIYNELHLKVAIKDTQRILERDAPLVIWNDPQQLSWSAEEAELLAEDAQSRHLLSNLPAGAHTRPEGGAQAQTILMLWDYHSNAVEPTWPLPVDPQTPEIVLRGLLKMIPGFRAYQERFPRPQVDGGYYTRTAENRPLIGPAGLTGAYVIGALSGYGLMAACAAGELLAEHVAQMTLPSYTKAFMLTRYDDPHYKKMLQTWGDVGQL